MYLYLLVLGRRYVLGLLHNHLRRSHLVSRESQDYREFRALVVVEVVE